MVWTGKIGLKGRQKDALDCKVGLRRRQKGGLDGKIGLKGRQKGGPDGKIGLEGRQKDSPDGKIGLEGRQKGRQGWKVGLAAARKAGQGSSWPECRPEQAWARHESCEAAKPRGRIENLLIDILIDINKNQAQQCYRIRV